MPTSHWTVVVIAQRNRLRSNLIPRRRRSSQLPLLLPPEEGIEMREIGETTGTPIVLRTDAAIITIGIALRLRCLRGRGIEIEIGIINVGAVLVLHRPTGIVDTRLLDGLLRHLTSVPGGMMVGMMEEREALEEVSGLAIGGEWVGNGFDLSSLIVIVEIGS